MSYVMMSRLERDTRRTTLLVRNTQAETYALGSIAWAMEQLRGNWEKQKPNQLIDQMPIKTAKEMNGYQINITINDMQARYNLNNLTSPDAQKDFVRLLKGVVPKISEQEANKIARAITDWISASSSQNEFSQYYAELPEPYRPAHRLMVSASELRLVKGVTPDIYNALKPYIIALPEPTQVNAITAVAPVLLTVSPNMTLEAANAIVTLRSQTPITSSQQFMNLDVVKNHQIQADKVTFSSKYFLAETDVSIEKQHTLLYTLLERNAQGKQITVNILWQSKGTW